MTLHAGLYRKASHPALSHLGMPPSIQKHCAPSLQFGRTRACSADGRAVHPSLTRAHIISSAWVLPRRALPLPAPLPQSHSSRGVKEAVQQELLTRLVQLRLQRRERGTHGARPLDHPASHPGCERTFQQTCVHLLCLLTPSPFVLPPPTHAPQMPDDG